MSDSKKIEELQQKVANLEAELSKLHEDNGIWDRIFRDNYWGMAICDAGSGELIKTNPSYEEMHGYGPLELIGRTIYDVFAPECHKDLPDIGQRIHDFGHCTYKTVHIRKDGSRFPVRTDSYEVAIHGKRLRVVSVWDITRIEQNERELALYRGDLEFLVKSRTEELEQAYARLRIEMARKEAAEQELEKANQEMIETIESISDGFMAINRQWMITYTNQALSQALQTHGMTGNLVGSVLGSETWQRNQMIWDSCQSVMKDGYPKRFELYSKLIGRWIEFSIYPRVSGISVFMRFIDDRKKLEKMVEEEHLRLYTLFNAFPGLIYVLEENYRIRFANHSFREKFGQCEGRNCHNVIAGANCPCSDCVIPLIVKNFTPSRNERVYNHRVYEIYSQSYTDVDGTKVIFLVLIDITDRKNADREFGRLERLNMVGEMAAGIAHEVRNPLTTVRGFLQLLAAKENTQEYHDYFKIMIDELDRANLIITDFLNIARDKPVDFMLVNLAEIMRALLPLLRADALNQDKEIRLELDSVPDIWGNENELRQLLLNLARNGFEAMQPGGALTIETSKTNNCVILKVSDQGGGLDPVILEKIGTPFLTTKERGTGLGLAICQSIVVRHNAVMEFDSDSSGTTVCIKFPDVS
ncbi:PAS domain S-box protein [Desulfosporosinus sp. PR]|uniref:PAS domain S-box protein n=1 Tax=Candidatus Desulfosporosinus nitrosoreducens TaxID=3401928 RepID=UPI0027FD05A2|nr:PAS domain S-box protein [Desulfosporosinus sp. PR]MDQ7092001.1 PAS domain S-box protein [Desulfosporosinus sp. PR]